MRKAICLSTVAMLLLVACGKENEAKAPTTPSIAVTASNYKFAAPSKVLAGAVSIRFHNNGPEPHQAQIFRLKAGIDAAKVIATAKTGDLNVYPLGTLEGGPEAVDKGETQLSEAVLQPGRYVFLCFVPNAKGQNHASLGMVKPFTVTTNAAPAAPPTADYKASMTEFSFTGPAKWTGTIQVDNTGTQPHEFQVMEIAPGRTEKEFLDSFKSPTEAAGPPPWATQGGIAAVAPGGRGYFTIDLKPGTYFMMCFVADPKTKAPHFALGMLQKFEVK